MVTPGAAVRLHGGQTDTPVFDAVARNRKNSPWSGGTEIEAVGPVP